MASVDKLEEPDHSSSNWFFPREHIEKNSPSRKDGIDLKKETYLRKSYCTFLQDLGMRLKVPQVTIATSIVFCHRFFLRQSHAKNDRYLIATSCMFLAGKVEETPQKLCDVIFLSYEIRNKKDPTAVQRIKQKDVYEPQKELVLLGERMILTTLGFDLNIHHPYKPLVAAIKKFKVAQNALAQVAWNFVNDGLRTSLCLQFKPHHIAAGAIFLAAKFLKVKLPSEGEKVWWQEFDVTPRQLEEVSNQMLELYEQNREAPASRVSDPSTTANQSRAVGDSARDTKGKVSSGIVRSVHDVAPAATDEHRDTSEKDAIESKARVGSSSKVSCQPKSGAMSDLKITMEGEAKCVADMNRDKSNSNEIFHSSIQVAETKMSVQVTEISTCSGGSNACVNDTKSVSHAVVQFSEVTVDQKCKGSIENGEPAADTNSAGTHPCEVRPSEGMISDGVDDVKQDDQTSQPKSGWVDLADVDIDRVKAAIQRRKKGDRKRSLAKRELTDEEELLEMELENGRSDVPNGLHHDDRDLSVMDLEAEELLERGFERGKERDVHLRNSLLLHKHADKEKLDIDGCILAEQERDHKRPRVDSGK
ncbi:hypothetical protein KP509_17G065700 [Ceratopteris richardii]|uniref:Cyclin-like domain-containing protein n=1 Tax=Ceratopteris richardii TaxID=49495 RepID=A0A8T2SYY9_CERRI|nr:hypothetical protein KP509_17G065700 [Ceratopteris richardii]